MHGYDLEAELTPGHAGGDRLRRHDPGRLRGGAARGRHGAAPPPGADRWTVLAHGVGSRTDLPIPLGLALYGAGAAILLSFAVLLLFWRRPKLGGAVVRVARCPPGVQRAGRLARGPARGCRRSRWRVAVLVVVVAVRRAGRHRAQPRALGPLRDVLGGAGAGEPAARPGLAGGQPAAAAAPRAARRPARRARRRPARRRSGCGRRRRRCSSSCGWSWSTPTGPSRRRSAVFLIGYAVVHLALAPWFGEEWFAARRRLRGVLRRSIARLSPWGRRDDGRLVLRNPLANAIGRPGRPRAGRGRRRPARVDGVRRALPHRVLADRPRGGERQPLGHRSGCS